MTPRGVTAGHNRERQVKALLVSKGWVVVRAAASLGCADLVALRNGDQPMLVEVKSTAGGPWKTFGPAARAALSRAADQAGADAYLCWWPPRLEPRWFDEGSWP